jgi:hypothetical protein
MSVSIYIAAVVFVKDAGGNPERPARPTVVVPSASLPAVRTDGRMTPLLVAPDHFNDPSLKSA